MEFIINTILFLILICLIQCDSYKELDDHIEGLVSANNKDVFIKNNIKPREPDLEEIMIYLERSNENESFTL